MTEIQPPQWPRITSGDLDDAKNFFDLYLSVQVPIHAKFIEKLNKNMNYNFKRCIVCRGCPDLKSRHSKIFPTDYENLDVN